jgi:hypothetical protein
MRGYVLRQHVHRSVWVFLVSLYTLALPVFAQQTVPVTVAVQFGDAAPAAFGGAGGGNLAASTISAAGKTGFLVFKELALPAATTAAEKKAEQAAAQGGPRTPRVFGGALRYERVDFDNGNNGLDGDIYSTNVHGAWDINHFSLGVFIPYDHLALKSFDANHIGMILYGRVYTAYDERLLSRSDREQQLCAHVYY